MNNLILNNFKTLSIFTKFYKNNKHYLGGKPMKKHNYFAIPITILFSITLTYFFLSKIFAQKIFDLWDLYPIMEGKKLRYNEYINDKLIGTKTINIENVSYDKFGKVYTGQMESIIFSENFSFPPIVWQISVFEQSETLWLHSKLISHFNFDLARKQEIKALLKRPILIGTKWDYYTEDGNKIKCEIIDTSYKLKIQGRTYENCVVIAEEENTNLSKLFSKLSITINYFCPGIGLVLRKYCLVKPTWGKDHKNVESSMVEILTE
ncbi:MAG: hypothetical protein N2316_07950 [Spirochaetes bacterium]|nr:hypothetical protein [Spirochaetota bacterium]